jgi:beta-galactosidase
LGGERGNLGTRRIGAATGNRVERSPAAVKGPGFPSFLPIGAEASKSRGLDNAPLRPMIPPSSPRAMAHDFLHDLCDRLHDTPMQRKLRALAPMPIGTVFIQWPEMTEEDIRGHFRSMRQLGFTNLKGQMTCAPMTEERLGEIALEEGILPWWYDIGGWEPITPELLERLGLPRDLDVDAAIEHPKMVAHQTDVLRRRLARKAAERARGINRQKGFLPAESDPNAVAGVVHAPEGTTLPPDSVPFFVAWLQRTYADVEALKQAWNARSSSFGRAARDWVTWEDVAAGVPRFPIREFRHLRDILRFKADVKLDRLRQRVQDNMSADPEEPQRTGGEISIFLPHTSWGIDMEGYAGVIADAGAFYPSMHPGWHLEEVEFELVRPTYMQASMCVDWAKGAWSAPFESSGGPQWWSGGGKVPFVPSVQELQPAFTFTEGTMTQLLYSYLAAGFRGFGLWCWNPRDAGWEAGEYALCDRNNAVTPRAIRVGQIGRAMTRLRRELWQARKEPLVGLFQDWENDAMWAALATAGRDRYKMDPVKARIGAGRALINANVPWEHVTGRQLERGLGPRYRTLYLPAVMCLHTAWFDLFEAFVRQGGRLVLDMPGAWLDERGHLVSTVAGSPFERLFGVVLHEYGHANNVPHAIGDVDLDGFTAVMTPTVARVVERYPQGGAAITENRLGNGTAVVLGAPAALACLRPGNTAMEWLLVRTALGDGIPPLFACADAIVYRLAAPAADHYFVLNDGPARTVRLDTGAFRYTGAEDPVSGDPIDLDAIPVEADSGRWVRCMKA